MKYLYSAFSSVSFSPSFSLISTRRYLFSPTTQSPYSSYSAPVISPVSASPVTSDCGYEPNSIMSYVTFCFPGVFSTLGNDTLYSACFSVAAFTLISDRLLFMFVKRSVPARMTAILVLKFNIFLFILLPPRLIILYFYLSLSKFFIPKTIKIKLSCYPQCLFQYQNCIF